MICYYYFLYKFITNWLYLIKILVLICNIILCWYNMDLKLWTNEQLDDMINGISSDINLSDYDKLRWNNDKLW